MNLKLLAGASVLAFASAFAQDGYFAEETAPAAAETAPSPYEAEPVAQAPVAEPVAAPAPAAAPGR